MDRQKGVRGQSLAEFAIVASVLLLIMMAVFDLGRVFYIYVVITNAAREGAYYGAMHPDDDAGIRANALMEAEGSGVALDPSRIHPSGPVDSGFPKAVCVEYTFSLFTSIMRWVLQRDTIELTSCAQMVIY